MFTNLSIMVGGMNRCQPSIVVALPELGMFMSYPDNEGVRAAYWYLLGTEGTDTDLPLTN